MPFVTIKVAMSADGRIATSSGDSKYITSTEARKAVHQLRTEADAVLVGVNTVIRDNPQLTPRLVQGKDPLKIVLDSTLKMPEKCNLMKEPSKLLVATTNKASKSKLDALRQKGVNIVILNQKNGMVDLKQLMEELGKREITSVMIEGGTEVNSSAIKAGIVDKIVIFAAPKIIGSGKGAIGNLGIKKIDRAINLKNTKTEKVGNDLMIEGDL